MVTHSSGRYCGRRDCVELAAYHAPTGKIGRFPSGLSLVFPVSTDVSSTLFLSIGTGTAAAIALLAWRRGLLSGRGALVAAIGGALSMRAGVSWGGFLVLWYLYASLLSRAGQDVKAEHSGDVISKGGRRDAWQVLANGGVYFALAAWVGSTAATTATGAADPAVLAAAALVAAGADTTATEVGTWWSGTAVSLRTWQHVPAGTSGAVSLSGTLAMVLAALCLATMAVLTDLIPSGACWLVAAAGTVGALLDSVVGATLQARRRCLRCGMATEQQVHRCGGETHPAGGVAWMNNDAVNALCTLTAAGTAMLLSGMTG